MYKHHSKRNPHYRRLIGSTRWRRTRLAYLVEHPLCERCLEQEQVTPASEVHHIKPLEDYTSRPDMMEHLAYAPINLQALCRPCHIAVHTEMGRGGKARAKAIAREQTERFVRTFLSGGEEPSQAPYLDGECRYT